MAAWLPVRSVPTISRKICSRVSGAALAAGASSPGRGGGTERGAQLFDGALGDQLAAVDDADVGAQALDDFEHVRGEEDGSAARDHALQHRLQRAGGNGVDAFEGLVEEKNFGPVDDGGGQREFFLHAVGEVGDQLLVLVGEAHEIEQFGSPLGGGGFIEAVHAADEAEIFAGGEAAEERHAFGHDADLAFEFGGVFGEVGAEDADRSGGGREQAGEHLDGGGFAGAVGAEEAEELPGLHGEVHVVDGGEVAKAAGELGGLDGGGHSLRNILGGKRRARRLISAEGCGGGVSSMV